jgi:hypothetical protein
VGYFGIFLNIAQSEQSPIGRKFDHEANPQTSEFYNYNASVVLGWGVFQSRRKYF